jgi:K+-transporting ATPase ATPase C chain
VSSPRPTAPSARESPPGRVGPSVKSPIPRPTRSTTAPTEMVAGERPSTTSPGRLREGAAALRASAVLIGVILLLGGVVYPLAITAIAQQLTPVSANGSLLYGPDGNAVASSLIGQNITNQSLFWLRPSMIDYQPFSGAGNEVPYGPTDPLLLNETRGFIQAYGLQNASAPLDLVSVSSSGLDPYITVGSAWVQIPRVSNHTNLSQAALNEFVNAHSQPPFLGIFGPPEVNVIQLDLLLIQALASHAPLNGV